MNTNTMYMHSENPVLRVVEKSMLNKKIDELDHLSPNGVYAVPEEPNEPRLKVREMYSYCKKHGKRPEDLTPKERESFLVYDEK